MSAVAESVCVCSSVGADPSVVRLAECHHRYFRGDRELTSVSRVLKSTWPIPPDFSKADPAVLDNARERGIAVDRLFSAYVEGKLDRIPAGTRTDAKDLFMKLMEFWNARPDAEKPARAQVLLADHEIAGTCDILTANGTIWDIKASYNIEAIYQLQLGAYADLYDRTYGVLPKLGIIHVTARLARPQLIPLDARECLDDWRKVREMWGVVRRRTA